MVLSKYPILVHELRKMIGQAFSGNILLNNTAFLGRLRLLCSHLLCSHHSIGLSLLKSSVDDVRHDAVIRINTDCSAILFTFLFTPYTMDQTKVSA